MVSAVNSRSFSALRVYGARKAETILSVWHALVMFRSKTRGSPSIPQQVLAYTITPLSIELNPCAW